MNHSIRRTSAFFALLMLTSAFATAQVYEVTDLGSNVFPAAINNQGVVVGNVNTPPADPLQPPVAYPFIWQNGTMTTIKPAGWTGGALLAINNNGVAAGQAQLPDPTHPTMPFTYTNGVVTAVPVGDAIGAALAINDAGAIGGFIQTGSGGRFGATAPFLVENGVLTALPSLGGAGGGVTAINSGGIAVGGLSDPSSATFAVYWENHQLHVLPQLGGNNSTANDINDAGVIAGATSTASQVFPGLYETHAAIWQNGALTDLGGLAGANFTTAWGINEAGEVVGNAFGFTGSNKGFLYQNGSMQALDDLAGAATGWQFWFARAINDNGQIAGYGVPPNASNPYDIHGFVLSIANPTPSQMIEQLKVKIDAFGLSGGTATSLKAKLNAVLDSLAKNGAAACNQLNAFTNEVSAQSGKGLTAAQANELLTAAARIAAAIGC